MKRGKTLEGFVHYVYSSLISLEDSNILVSKNTTIIGRSGAKHEFDVYYEFFKANVRHRVAIECKEYNKPVEKGKITEFYGKINDVDNVSGVIVSQHGYQSGAKEYASHYGISLLTVDDLPTIHEILSLQIRNTFLPDESVVGQPFWTLMETKNGNVTGTYTCVQIPDGVPEKTIPLFYSKTVATKFLSIMKEKNSIVRGMNQNQLKALVILAIKDHIKFAVIPFEASDRNNWLMFPLDAGDIKKDYVLNN